MVEGPISSNFSAALSVWKGQSRPSRRSKCSAFSLIRDSVHSRRGQPTRTATHPGCAGTRDRREPEGERRREEEARRADEGYYLPLPRYHATPELTIRVDRVQEGTGREQGSRVQDSAQRSAPSPHSASETLSRSRSSRLCPSQPTRPRSTTSRVDQRSPRAPS